VGRGKRGEKTCVATIKGGAEIAVGSARLQLTLATNLALTMMKFNRMAARTFCLLFFFVRYADGEMRRKMPSTHYQEDSNYCHICSDHTMCLFPVNIHENFLNNTVCTYVNYLDIFRIASQCSFISQYSITHDTYLKILIIQIPNLIFFLS